MTNRFLPGMKRVASDLPMDQSCRAMITRDFV